MSLLRHTADRLRETVRRLVIVWSRDTRVIGLVGIAGVFLIAAFTMLILRENNRIAHAAAENHAKRLAKTVAHQLGTTLAMVEGAMRYAGAEILETNGPARLTELIAKGQMPSYLLKPGSFLLIGADGRPAPGGLAPDDPRRDIDYSDRDYVGVHLKGASRNTYIGHPVSDRVNGQQIIPVSRPLRRPDGSLVGVLVAMIDVDALEDIWFDVGLGRSDVIELAGSDGTVWLRWPRVQTAGTARLDLAFASKDRLAWPEALAGWPLGVTAALDRQTIFAETARVRVVIVVSAVAASMLVMWFSVLLMRRTRQANAIRMRLFAAINAVPMEFVEYDHDRKLLLANDAARSVSPWRQPGDATGRTIEAVMEGYIAHFQTPETEAAWKAWAAQVVADFDRGGIADSRRPDGQWRRSYVSDMPGGGRVVVRIDISELKQREEKLASEMERLHSVLQSTGAVVLMLDRGGRVVLANQSALDVLGRDSTQVVGRPYDELKFAGLGASSFARWQVEGSTEPLQPIEFETSMVDAGGERRIFRFTANPAQDGEGRLRYIVLIGVDDTRRRLAEIRLFDASRLANLGEMASGIAHEINQPLAVIRLAADSLREELDAPEVAVLPTETRDFMVQKLDRIASQTERASGIIHDLRTVARKPANDPQPFDLAEAMRVGGDLLREQLRLARIDFRLDLPSPGPMVLGEPSRVQQILINLVLNARDAILDRLEGPTGGNLGHIDVRIDPGRVDDDAALIVEDDGPGIPPAVMARLFEPFFTTKPVGKGTGLGLSISYDIVNRMGGKIVAANRPEGGAQFRVMLPKLRPVA
jgi:PAS domain S-box-containing protein